MRTLEEILQEEEMLRNAKKQYHCLCYAMTSTVCTVCKVHMDMDHDSPYPSCDPSCKYSNFNSSKILDVSHSHHCKDKNAKSTKNEYFITFTRANNEEEDYTKLFAVLDYIKKCKSIKQYWYAFEFTKKGTPHLHTIIHMQSGKYLNAIERTLETKIEKESKKGWMDKPPQKGTLEEAKNYLFKDVSKTEDFIHNNNINYFLLYNIKLNNGLQEEIIRAQEIYAQKQNL
ncbi:capsid [uncultured virus]|uniref:Capsid n=1 Tax=uncultured virus TaxID=340016 RepID=A0A2K9LSJ3_9VIRU|nr:capsid [uncultured virus]